MAAASSIKTPILLAVLELLDQGTLQWNELPRSPRSWVEALLDGLPAPGQSLSHP